MGTWGTGILADDDAMEVYEGYCRLYNEGHEHTEARAKLQQDCADLLTDDDLGPVFWLALAKAQWEYGAFDGDVLQRVSDIAEQGLGLERWREQGPRVVAKRQKAVSEFLDKIRVPNPKPKKRKKVRKYPAIFEPGDCLAVPLADGMYGAAFVVAIDNHNESDGIDFIGLLEYFGAEKPSLEHFSRAPWLSSPATGPFLVHVSPFHMVFARSFRNEGKGIERLAQRCVRSDTPGYDGTGHSMCNWSAVSKEIESYAELLSFDDPAAREAYFKIRYYAIRVNSHQYAEFEPLLLGGYEELTAGQTGIRATARTRILCRAAARIAKFYEGWGKAEEAAKWRQKVELI
jgi:hypothetical protein